MAHTKMFVIKIKFNRIKTERATFITLITSILKRKLTVL